MSRAPDFGFDQVDRAADPSGFVSYLEAVTAIWRSGSFLQCDDRLPGKRS
jgi:hypothetical protein